MAALQIEGATHNSSISSKARLRKRLGASKVMNHDFRTTRRDPQLQPAGLVRTEREEVRERRTIPKPDVRDHSLQIRLEPLERVLQAGVGAARPGPGPPRSTTARLARGNMSTTGGSSSAGLPPSMKPRDASGIAFLWWERAALSSSSPFSSESRPLILIVLPSSKGRLSPGVTPGGARGPRGAPPPRSRSRVRAGHLYGFRSIKFTR